MGLTARRANSRKTCSGKSERTKKSLGIEADERRKTEGKIKFISRFANAIELAMKESVRVCVCECLHKIKCSSLFIPKLAL